MNEWPSKYEQPDTVASIHAKLVKYERWGSYILKFVLALALLFGTYKIGYKVGFSEAVKMATEFMAQIQQGTGESPVQRGL